jgi:hypothetical protein
VSVQQALTVADPGASEVLLRLAVEQTDSDPEEAVARLVQEAAERARRALESSATDPLAIARESAKVKLAIEALLEAATRRASIEELLTWLGSRGEDRG